MKLTGRLMQFSNIVFLLAFVHTLSHYNAEPLRTVLYAVKFIVFVVATIYGIALTRFRLRRFQIRLLGTVLAWLFVLLVTTFWSSDPINGVFLVFSYLLLVIFAMGVLPNFAGSRQTTIGVVQALVNGVLCGLIVVSFLSYLNSSVSYVDPGSLRLRYTFGLRNPNLLGMLAFTLFAGSTSLYFYGKTRYIWLTPVATVYGILSGSRTAILSMATCVALYVGLRLASRFSFFVRTIAMCWGLIVISILAISSYGSQISLVDLDRLLSGRVSLWADVFQSGLFNLFFGQGIGSEIHRHNYYVNVIESGGLLALLLLVSFLLLVLAHTRFISDPRRRAIAQALFMTWLVYSMSESALLTAGNIASIYIWSDLMLALTSRDRNPTVSI